MQTVGILVFVSLLLPLAGMVGRSSVPSVCSRRDGFPSRATAFDATLKKLDQDSRSAFKLKQFAQGAEFAEAGYERARAAGDQAAAARFLTIAGACRFASFHYRAAMRDFLEARQVAERNREWQTLVALSINISGLYLQFGDIDAANESIRRGWQALAKVPEAPQRAEFLLQAGRLKAEAGALDAAIGLLQAGAEEAERRGDTALRAQALGIIGYELVSHGRLAEGEAPLIEAFRIRKLFGLRDLGNSYQTLAWLRIQQGDLRSAAALLDGALRMAGQYGAATPWVNYHLRGMVDEAAGNLGGALRNYGAALASARRWRLEVLPSDAARLSAEVALDQVYAAFVRTAVRAYFRAPDVRLLEAGFAAAEENRAASLRALLDEWPADLPPEYAEQLAALRQAETALVKQDSPENRGRVRELSAALGEIEMRAGLEDRSARRAEFRAAGATAAQQLLRPDEAYFGFTVGEPESYLWTLTSDGAAAHRLASRRVIEQAVTGFLDSVRKGAAGPSDAGGRLYDALFGALDRRTASRPRWILALDESLFRVPFAALAVSDAGRRVFLAERHSLRIVPGIGFAAGNSARDEGRRGYGSFVAAGDPVYNGADARWAGDRGWWPRARRQGPRFELARLAGSGREIKNCALAWGAAGPRVLLEGADVNRERLRQALASDPGVLHLALHLVPSPSRPLQALVALSMTAGGEPDLLSAAEIRRWRTRAPLVVMSGCSSGLAETPASTWRMGSVGPGAQTLPETGLMGLTRAWLAAGAGSVAASLWPTPDDSGDFFVSFYKALQRDREPAGALRAAQLEMLGSGAWRARPAYWSAYYIVSRE
jgi:CHAT domain-containing protein